MEPLGTHHQCYGAAVIKFLPLDPGVAHLDAFRLVDMTNQNAIDILRAYAARGTVPEVSIISPVVATVLAAKSVRDRKFAAEIRFSTQCEQYAQTTNLIAALQRAVTPNVRAGALLGQTYSGLTRLSHHEEPLE